MREQQTTLDYKEILNGTEQWTDASFTFPDSISWADLPPLPEYSIKSDFQWLDWKRLSGEYEHNLYTMWGSEEIGVSDIV